MTVYLERKREKRYSSECRVEGRTEDGVKGTQGKKKRKGGKRGKIKF